MKTGDRDPVLITGASSGIGRALVEEFQRRRFPVIATARKLSALSELESPETLLLQLDVNSDASVQAAIAAVRKWCSGIGILVNNAGWGLMGPVADLEIEAFRSLLDTNLIGALRMLQAVLPGMLEQGRGMIVNIGSVSGVVTTPFAGAYCASKAALHSLSEALRMEVAPFGVRVVTVQPGAVVSSFGSRAAREIKPPPEDSPYFEIRREIEKRAAASQEIGMPAREFARRLADQLLRKDPPALIRLAPLSRKLPLLGKLPVRLRSRILSRRFGLDRLGSDSGRD